MINVNGWCAGGMGGISHLEVPYGGALSGRVEWGGEKNKLGSISKRPMNILKVVIRSARSFRPAAAVSLRRRGDKRQLPNL